MSSELAVLPEVELVEQPIGLLHGNSTICPHCGANLIHSAIPEQDQHLFGGKLHFLRVIGQSSIRFDRCLAYQCPDCEQIDVIPGCEAMWAEDLAYWAKFEADHRQLDQEDQVDRVTQFEADKPPEPLVSRVSKDALKILFE